MTRAFQQRRRAVADLVALVPSSVVSIVLAAQGHGAMSLAYGSLVGNLTATTLVLVLAPARPLPGWRRNDAAALLRVGLPLAGTSLVLLATMNVDYVVVGRQLGTTALGLYLLAFNLSSWPSNLLSIAVRRVAIPGFARLAGDRAELEQAFTEVAPLAQYRRLPARRSAGRSGHTGARRRVRRAVDAGWIGAGGAGDHGRSADRVRSHVRPAGRDRPQPLAPRRPARLVHGIADCAADRCLDRWHRWRGHRPRRGGLRARRPALPDCAGPRGHRGPAGARRARAGDRRLAGVRDRDRARVARSDSSVSPPWSCSEAPARWRTRCRLVAHPSTRPMVRALWTRRPAMAMPGTRG